MDNHTGDNIMTPKIPTKFQSFGGLNLNAEMVVFYNNIEFPFDLISAFESNAEMRHNL